MPPNSSRGPNKFGPRLFHMNELGKQHEIRKKLKIENEEIGEN